MLVSEFRMSTAHRDDMDRSWEHGMMSWFCIRSTSTKGLPLETSLRRLWLSRMAPLRSSIPVCRQRRISRALGTFFSWAGSAGGSSAGAPRAPRPARAPSRPRDRTCWFPRGSLRSRSGDPSGRYGRCLSLAHPHVLTRFSRIALRDRASSAGTSCGGGGGGGGLLGTCGPGAAREGERPASLASSACFEPEDAPRRRGCGSG